MPVVQTKQRQKLLLNKVQVRLPLRQEPRPQPKIFRLSKRSEQIKLRKLLKEYPHTHIIDTYDNQLREWFVLQKPWLHLDHEARDKEFAAFSVEHHKKKQEWQAGVWVYLSWRHTLLHLLEQEMYQEVRTSRNRNLITPDEQKKYYNSVIGIAGQSVGNSCTLSIVLGGGGGHVRLADPDTLELTNLNRIRGSITDLTSPKVHMTARQVYELDPYTKLELFTEGLTEKNIKRFFDGPPQLDIVIDEIDNLGMKIRLREEAKKRRIPVVSAADNGDSGVLDIERHDLYEDIPPFHGRGGDDIAQRVLGKELPLPVIGKIIGEELIGFDIVEERMQNSLLEIGKTIPTWPQLGTAATLNGVLVAVAVRKILTDQPLTDDRAVASVPGLLDPAHNKPEEIARRAQATEQFAHKYNEAIEAFLNSQK